MRASIAEERARARTEVERELSDARADLVALRREIASARRIEANRRRQGRGDEERHDPRAADRDRRLGAAADASSRAAKSLGQASRAPRDERPVEVGSRVIDESGLRGEIAAIRDGVAEVRGSLGTIRIPVERLRRDGRSPSTRPSAAPEARPAVAAASPEIDVRGQRAEVAKQAVRDHVDLAVLAGRGRIRVIHGHGTGALKVAIREELTRHPLVVSHEGAPLREGGDGVTVVVLEDDPGGS